MKEKRRIQDILTTTDVYQNKKNPLFRRIMEMFMVLVLAVYPLRHIHWGIDLWDTGYSYANFRYMGMESMDPMWMFSTYLSNTFGHFLTWLPGGKTVLGLNLYTGLVVSLIAVIAYLFCTRGLRFSQVPVFVGEFVAISLCWCPSAILYNYLTYLFMLLAVIFLYYGLDNKKNHMLLIAGIMLGINLFVRFSNLPEVVFIFAVWAYTYLEVINKVKGEEKLVKKREYIEGLKRAGVRTLWSFVGYMLAVGAVIAYISARYGFSKYVNAIKSLFAMTDGATDYKATSMIRGIIDTYRLELYWIVRIFAVLLVAIIICSVFKMLDVHFGLGKNRIALNANKKFSFLYVGYALTCMLSVFMIYWMYRNSFFGTKYILYGSMINPAIVLLMLTLLVCLVEILHPAFKLKDKLISGLVFLVIMITPIGSNNMLYPAFNNLFIAAPYFAWNLWRILRIEEWAGASRGDIKTAVKKKNIWVKISYVIKKEFSLFSVKAVIGVLAMLMVVQFSLFGFNFAFAEGDPGLSNIEYTVNSVKALKGMRMTYDRAKDIYELHNYIQQAELEGKKVILFGDIPSLSFYLEMPGAITPWPDLRSYNIKTMSKDLERVSASGDEYPVVITLAEYMKEDAVIDNPKFELLLDFIGKNNYKLSFANDFYAVLIAY